VGFCLKQDEEKKNNKSGAHPSVGGERSLGQLLVRLLKEGGV
jgi:hypothetical protein